MQDWTELVTIMNGKPEFGLAMHIPLSPKPILQRRALRTSPIAPITMSQSSHGFALQGMIQRC